MGCSASTSFATVIIDTFDDTLPGVEEGLNAGMWTIGLAKSGNEIGLNESEIAELSADTPEQRALLPRIVSQPEMLEMLVSQASAFPGFRFYRGASVADLIQQLHLDYSARAYRRDPLYPSHDALIDVFERLEVVQILCKNRRLRVTEDPTER